MFLDTFSRHPSPPSVPDKWGMEWVNEKTHQLQFHCPHDTDINSAFSTFGEVFTLSRKKGEGRRVFIIVSGIGKRHEEMRWGAILAVLAKMCGISMEEMPHCSPKEKAESCPQGIHYGMDALRQESEEYI